MTDVVTFGESMARFTTPRRGPMRHAGSLDVGIAGAESNLAIGLARLGVAASWFGRVGDDEFGRLITQVLRAEGVDTRAIVDSEAPTGLLFKERRAAWLNRVTYYRDGSAGSRLNISDLDLDLIANASLLHLTGITAALSETARETCWGAVAAARAAGTTVSLDLNVRRQLWQAGEAVPVLTKLVQQADLVFATVDEARLMTDGVTELDLARGLAALGPEQVILKRGKAGALALVGREQFEAPIFQVQEVDPVGAGDAFAAGYLSEVLRGGDIPERLAAGARCGAFAVSVDGDWEGLPSSAELPALGSHDDVHR